MSCCGTLFVEFINGSLGDTDASDHGQEKSKRTYVKLIAKYKQNTKDKKTKIFYLGEF